MSCHSHTCMSDIRQLDISCSKAKEMAIKLLCFVHKKVSMKKKIQAVTSTTKRSHDERLETQR